MLSKARAASKENLTPQQSEIIDRSGSIGALLALEPRIMFDGAALLTGAEVVHEQVTQDQSTQEQHSQTINANLEGKTTANPLTDKVDLFSALSTVTTPSDRKEIVFIDTNVDDFQTLMEGIDPNAEVILLDSTRDGIERIAEILGERTDIDAVHIISHGDSGELRLGTGILNLASMQGEYADELATINRALTEEADWLIYGCNFGEGVIGQEAATLLAELTGADIAASNNLTGNAELGGDWELEIQTGTIESAAIVAEQAQETFAGVLDITTGLQGLWNFDADAADSSGNSNDGTRQGDAFIDTTDATDIVGEGKLSLDGTDDYVDLSTHTGSFSGLTEGTISAWVKTTATGDRTIFDISNGGIDTNYLWFHLSSGKLTVEIRDNNTVVLDTSSSVSINDGAWHHVAFSASGTGNQLYIDGIAAARTFNDGSAATTTFISDLSGLTNTTIGSVFNGSYDFEMLGTLDDVRVYDRELSAADIDENFATSNPLVVDTTSDASNGDTSSISALLADKGVDGFISLREAIEAANATAGTDTISFNIGTGLQTITLGAGSGLPGITDSVILDATTQPGYAGTPIIQIDGTAATGATAGLLITTDNSTIKGFIIHSSADEGIEIDTGNNNTIQNNWVGIDSTGMADPNTDIGILLTTGSANNQIGGTGLNEGNLIAGNTTSGLVIRNAGSDSNIVEGNFIGVLNDGVTVRANGGSGVEILDTASTNRIGGTTVGGRNIISGNSVNGILISDAGTTWNLVQGNYIGLDSGGTMDVGNTLNGVMINLGASGNTIGGNVSGARNVISGNNDEGIQLDGAGVAGNTIQGNYIGLNAAGTGAVGNSDDGIDIDNSDNTTIGGTTALERNVISGNDDDGVDINGDGTIVKGNYIGTDATGTAGLGNTDFGVNVHGGSTNSVVGGTGVNDGNRITSNTNGVRVAEVGSTDNAILGNQIYSNTTLGIDLVGGTEYGSGVTANDTNDADTGVNDLLNVPVLTNVVQNGVDVDIDFDVDLPAGNYRIEFFDNFSGLDSSGFGEGETFVGFVHITATGAAGYESFSTTLSTVTASNILNITATATEADGTYTTFSSTSEFGPQFLGAGVLEVTTTSDTSDGDTSSIAGLQGNRGADGEISLREAIAATNSTTNIGGNPDEIHFNISTALVGGAHTIDVLSALPVISDSVIIDGTTDSDFGSTPILELNGSGTVGTEGLNITAGDSTVRGLVINNFGSDSIVLAIGDNNVIAGNYIGTDVTGMTALGGVGSGVKIWAGSDNNTIGGTSAADLNLISGNSQAGVELDSVTGNIIQGNNIGTNAAATAALGNSYVGVWVDGGASSNTIGGAAVGASNVISGNSDAGIRIEDSGSDSNIIQGNFIGTDSTGILNLQNAGAGIEIATSATNNQIGGTAVGEENSISNNQGDGVRLYSDAGTGNRILRNSIHSNTGTGIDLNNDGVTTNDVGDVDTGANNIQNFPVLTNVVQSGADLDIDFDVDLPAGNYRIEFFDNTSGLDSSGFGEGGTYLGSAHITVTGAAGYESFSTTLSTVTASDVLNITTTATEADGTYTMFSSTSEFGPQYLGAGVLEVTTTSDTSDGDTSSITSLLGNRGADGEISLREAIAATNSTTNIGGNPDEIHFNISAALVSGTHTITPGSALPDITDAVIIDGTTESDFGSTPVIELDGTSAGGVDGLQLATGSDGSTIRGLAINRFFDGIEISSANNVIEGNFIGMDVNGTADLGNTRDGISIMLGGTNNTIGGTTAAQRNLISGNDRDGIRIDDAVNNIIRGNYIGTDITGTIDLGNSSDGIQLDGTSTGTTIGGTTSAARNVISGNTSDGISLFIGADSTTISANIIGLDVNGTSDLGNGGNGIRVQSDSNSIGGLTAGEQNIISGNDSDGIDINASATNLIRGNYIGTDITGTLDLGNTGEGILIGGAATGNIVGGSTSGHRNVISGNNANGIDFRDTGTMSNMVEGNYIGVDTTGTVALGNTSGGVDFRDGAQSNTVGGTSAGQRNIISANNLGIQVRDVGTDNNTILGNYIGTDVTGAVALGNTTRGIYVRGGSSGTTIGGSATDAGNIIAASGEQGIELDNSSNNTVQGNYIGTNAVGSAILGNTDEGIFIDNSAANNTIGGTASGAGNTIAYNSQEGLNLDSDAGTGNSILRNSIHSNSALGIDLDNDGVTTNDANDADTGMGSNNLQNFPVITSAVSSGAIVQIDGSLNTDGLNQNYRVEFFANATEDGSGNGEGERYLGFATVMTNGAGNAVISEVVTATVSAGEFITATATVDLGGGSYGDTSEFAANSTATGVNALTVDTTSDVSDGTTTSIGALLADKGADGFISLREAITAANNTTNDAAGADFITFEIEDLLVSGAHTIAVGVSGLDTITDAVVIDGTTDSDFSSTPIIVLAGSSVGAGIEGLFLGSGSDGSTIRGLVINQFDDDGIQITSDNNTIVGNYIGTDVTGTVDLGNNDDGIDISGMSNTIGGTTTADRNLISGNAADGIEIDGAGATGNTITGNYIGTDLTGALDLGNGDDGIRVDGGAASNTIGGTMAGLRNIISGNNDDGIEIDNSDSNTVQGNYIGTDVTGTVDLGNSDNGIQIQGGADTNIIGGTTAGARNIISGNNDKGIEIDGSAGNIVQGNYIGTDVTGTAALGNASGMRIDGGASSNLIGGTLDGAGNIIAHSSGGDGIRFSGAGTGNALLGNSISANAGLGIDLDTAGVTTNDVGDADIGSNNLQNFPVLTEVDIDSPTQVTISGTLDTDGLNQDYRIEFFKNTIATGEDPTNHGEGEIYLGFVTVPSDGSGDATFSTTLIASVSAGEFITSTATVDLGGGSYGDTSEYGLNAVAVAVNDAPVATIDPGDFNATITTQSPLSYWRLGESSGPTAGDAGSTGNNGTYNGVTFAQTGALDGDTNTAVRFNGSTDYVEIAHDPSYLLDNGSIQLWFNADSIGTNQVLFSKDSDGFDTGGHVRLSLLASGQIEFRLQSTTQHIMATTAGAVTAAAWHHVAITFGSNGMIVYVDGQEDGTNSYAGGTGTTSGGSGNFEPIAIGAGTTTSGNLVLTPLNEFFAGLIDEVAIFGNQLGAETIQDLYAAGLQDYTVDEDSTLNVSVPQGVLSNDYDAEGDALTATNLDTTGTLGLVTLNADGSFTYNPNSQFDNLAVGATATDTFTYTANDGAVDSNVSTVTVTITGVNDAPVEASIEGPALAYTENDGAVAITSTLAVTDVDDTNLESAVVQITGNYQNGEDVLAFTNQNGITGTWTVGTGTLSLSGTATVAQYEAAVRSLTYANTSETPSTLTRTVSFTVNDGTVDSNTQTRDIAVTAVNDAPVIINDGGGSTATVNVVESQTNVTTVLATDVDLPPDALTYTIIGGADQGLFVINAGSGVLTFSTAPDFEVPTDADTNGVYDVTVHVADGNGGFDTQAISVTVIDGSDAPTITSNGGGSTAVVTVAENQTALTTVTAIDSDLPPDVLTYTIVGGADSALFSINGGSGVLTFNSAPDFETPSDANLDGVYEVTVQVADGNGGIDSQIILVPITDLLEGLPTPPSVPTPEPSPNPSPDPTPEPVLAEDPGVEPVPFSSGFRAHSGLFGRGPDAEEPLASNPVFGDVLDLPPFLRPASWGTTTDQIRAYYSDPLDMTKTELSPEFFEQLNRFSHDLEETMVEQAEKRSLLATMMKGTGLTLSAGLAAWLVRSGAMLTWFLASLPAWRQLDPIPILGMDKKEKEEWVRRAKEAGSLEAREHHGLDQILQSKTNEAEKSPA